MKNYFENKETLLPFSVLETYKPLLAASMLMEGSTECESPEAMEEVIMKEAKQHGKERKRVGNDVFSNEHF